jgi:hypothetical protein
MGPPNEVGPRDTTPEGTDTTFTSAQFNGSARQQPALADMGLHIFPVDHPSLPWCAGLHKTTPCDGKRGKHPTVAWGRAATTDPRMIAAWFSGSTLNVGISCGPSNLVVLDEDEQGVLDAWAAEHDVTLPDTYTVTTGRGRHLYYRWDHTVTPITNSAARLFGVGSKIDVRGHGGFVVAAGSFHEQGRVYEHNSHPITELPADLAQLLIAARNTQQHNDNGDGPRAPGDPNSTPILYHDRHTALTQYAGRLRNAGLDRTEADILFRARWELCEQPPGKEAPYKRAKKTILDDVYARYKAGGAPVSNDDGNDTPRVWKASDLRSAAQPHWLAKQHIMRAAVNLLVGDEGIGKSLLWVWVAAAVTTGRALPAFGIPARDPANVMLVLTEDDWQTTALPRLKVAGADLDMVQVICSEKDGSGSPIFPRDMFLITTYEPKPALVVVDAWLDTVSAGLSVRDPQQARQALHPWREAATETNAAMLLLTHTNRVSTPNARDKYGATGELRKKARVTLYAQGDEDGRLVVGPEKMNTAAPVNASMFSIQSVQYFPLSDDDDGTIPKLVYLGESEMSAREHIAEAYQAESDTDGKKDAVGWLAAYLAGGPQWASDVQTAAELEDISKNKLYSAKKRMHVGSKRLDGNGSWFWHLPQHANSVPDVPDTRPDTRVSESGYVGNVGKPHLLSTSQDTQMMNGETRGHVGNSPKCRHCGDKLLMDSSIARGHCAKAACLAAELEGTSKLE